MYTNPAFRVAIEARGAKLLHYPRYAQDLNPLERAGQRVGAWAAARRQLMSREPQTAWDPMPPYDFADEPDTLFDALCEVTPDVAQEWLRDIGYNVPIQAHS